MPRKTAKSGPQRHLGNPQGREPGPSSGLSFRTIQKIATIHAGSGAIFGIFERRTKCAHRLCWSWLRH